MHLDLDLPSCSKFPISDQSSAIVLQSAFTVLVTKASLVPLLPAWEGMHRGTESTSTTACVTGAGEKELSEENSVLISFSF